MDEVAKMFAESLRYKRKLQNLTQEALAERLGVTPHTIQSYEAGRREPDFQMLGRLADALGIQPWELIQPQGAEPSRIEPTPTQALAVLARLVEGNAMPESEEWEKEKRAYEVEIQRLNARLASIESNQEVAVRVSKLPPSLKKQLLDHLGLLEDEATTRTSGHESKPRAKPHNR